MIVALEGLENILRAGEQQKTNDINDVATMIDEADGVSKIQALQYHANEGKMCILAGWSHTWRWLLRTERCVLQTFTSSR